MRWLPLVLVACASPGASRLPVREGAPTSAPSETSAATPPAEAAPAPDLSTTITVIEAPVLDAWVVTWQLATPASALIFDRRTPSNRHESWVPADGVTWSRDPSGDYETLVAQSPRQEFTVFFQSDDRGAGRTPALNVPFTDGSRLLFTGILGAYAFACEPTCTRRGQRLSRRWIFRSDPTRLLRVFDTEATAEVVWNEPAGDMRGTYVFAGTAAATRHEKLTLVADPALPAWLVDDTARVLPGFFASYGKTLGVPLDVSPLVLVSQTDPDARVDAMRGKTMAALIQLEAIGNEWARATSTRHRRWAELLAHEAFHLWNGQIARRADDKLDVWLSEGSAVFMAGLSLERAGLLSRSAYEARIIRSANDCLASLHGPLHAELDDPVYYACGELVHFLVDRALADRGGASAVWAALVARGSYTTADFVAAIDAPLRADVQQILDVGLGTDPAPYVQRLLAGARLRTKLAGGGRMLAR